MRVGAHLSYSDFSRVILCLRDGPLKRIPSNKIIFTDKCLALRCFSEQVYTDWECKHFCGASETILVAEGCFKARTNVVCEWMCLCMCICIASAIRNCVNVCGTNNIEEYKWNLYIRRPTHTYKPTQCQTVLRRHFGAWSVPHCTTEEGVRTLPCLR